MKDMNKNYDIIVVGGGHAGIEACLAPARMGMKTLLVTTDIKRIGMMPCNPAIGGRQRGLLYVKLMLWVARWRVIQIRARFKCGC